MRKKLEDIALTVDEIKKRPKENTQGTIAMREQN
jgi:hypothetical protein